MLRHGHCGSLWAAKTLLEGRGLPRVASRVHRVHMVYQHKSSFMLVGGSSGAYKEAPWIGGDPGCSWWTTVRL